MFNKKKNILYILSLYFTSSISMLLGLGYAEDWSNKNIITGIIFFCCYLTGAAHRYTLIFLLISFSILSLYFPTGLIYGKPTAEVLNPLLHTNKLEAIGYVLALKYYLLIPILFICIQYLIYRIVKNTESKKSLTTIILFYFFTYLSLFGISITNQSINEEAPLKNIISAYKIIQKQKEELKKYIGDNANIQINLIDNRDDTEVRVVIIGESVRKDYLSVYGYPLNTTPYLNTAKGIFVDGLIAAAPNTEQSLSRVLFKTLPDQNKIYWGVNFVSLANKAGYETYWISNQGITEYGDDIFYALAQSANHIQFFKKGNYSSNDTDDEEVLPIVSKIVNSNIKHKVIFVHMIGSHEPVCYRLGNFQPSVKTHNEASCYALTIKKLDLFIKKITNILNKKKYKLMYFSDHGLSVEKKRIFHTADIYEVYQIPLFYLDSEAKEHIKIKKMISSLNVLDLYSNFINIKTNFTNEKYSFHSITELKDNPDPLIYWKNYKHLSSIKNKQPPITDIIIDTKKSVPK
jgi:glucan phosphoethanolaminetransferase (alkaline phosphatase superfamily)